MILNTIARNAGLSLSIEGKLVKVETARRTFRLVGPVRQWGRVQLSHSHLGHVLRHSIGVSDLAEAEFGGVTLRVNLHDTIGVFKGGGVESFERARLVEVADVRFAADVEHSCVQEE